MMQWWCCVAVAADSWIIRLQYLWYSNMTLTSRVWLLVITTNSYCTADSICISYYRLS